MKIWGAILLLLATPVLAGDDAAIQSWGAEYFTEERDYGKFRQTKDEIKEALVEAVRPNLKPVMDDVALQRMTQALQLKIIEMKATGVPLDYMLYGQFVKEGTALITLRINYTDDISSIDWEFQTVTDGIVAAFFVSTDNGTAPTSMDDFYRWELVTK